jgi:DegV family protein with EDD domain
MADVAVVTDSCADLTPEVCKALGITVVPLTLTIGDESMPDGTLTQVEFFERMNASAQLPTTSQPSVGAFSEAYRRALESASRVVSVHISSKLSGTISSARSAAEEFGGRVHVVDTRNLSWGEGLQVLEAAKAAAAGLSPEAIVELVHHVRERVKLFVVLDSLDNLVKGGRISKFAGSVGGLLNVKMSITCRDGELVPVRPMRGTKAALDYTMRWVEEHMADARRGIFAIMHAMSEERALFIREAILERFETIELYMVETGTVIATHTGTGWGVAFLPEE